MRIVVHRQHLQPAQVRTGDQRLALHRALAEARGEPEGAALPGLALDADGAAHQLGEPLRDRQAEPGAAVFARGRAVRLLEGLEHAGPLLRRHADAGIADAQAFRPPEEKVNVLQVRLATNFKAAAFARPADAAMLRRLATDIEAARYDTGTGRIEVPVKLRVHDSVFVPLAKWAMLLAGNYRCVQHDGVRSIRDAVHADIAMSRSVYEWVVGVCKALGAAEGDLVPFDKYASAALSLQNPSSAARALAAGAPNIERTDRLVQAIAAQKGMRDKAVDEAVATVDEWLERNRRKAA